MDQELIASKMEKDMKEILKKVKNVVMESIFIKMAIALKVNGSKIRKMVQDHYLKLIPDILKKMSIKMERK